MKKLFLMFFAVASLGAGFTACGSDDDPDLKMYDNSEIIGTYPMNCEITVTTKVKDPVIQTSSVEFRKAEKSDWLSINSIYEFGNLSQKHATNFNFTNESKKVVTFSMDQIKNEGMVAGQIPAYVKTWFEQEYTSIDKVDIVTNGTTATLNLETKDLTFSYEAAVTIYGTVVSGATTTNPVDKHTFKYKYTTKAKE